MTNSYTITANEAIEMINNHNKRIDDYINGKLAEELGAKDGKINVEMWFKAQELIAKQDFYGIGMTILKFLKENGYDIKMDMQSHKLYYYGTL